MFINEGLMDCNAPLTQGLTDFLKDSEVLSPFFMNFIYTANATGSNNLGQLLEMEVAWRQQETYNAAMNIVHAIYASPDSIWQEEFKSLVEEDIKESELDWLAAYFAESDYTHAQSYVIQMSSIMQNTWNTILNAPGSLNGTEWATLYNRYLSEDEDMGLALSRLNMEQEELFWPVVNMSGWENKIASSGNKKPKDQIQSQALLAAFPNPFQDRLILTYTQDLPGKGIIQIFDSKGALVKLLETDKSGISELGTHAWSKGVYTANLIFEDFVISNIKFVKQ